MKLSCVSYEKQTEIQYVFRIPKSAEKINRGGMKLSGNKVKRGSREQEHRKPKGAITADK